MAKDSAKFVCQNCGYAQSRWEGKCSNCNEWNTFIEQAPVAGIVKTNAKPGKLQALDETTTLDSPRLDTKIPELNGVLGGGLVPGSLILLGGDPGIGKSTLALQVALRMSEAGLRIVYVSGEESVRQLKLRADRLSKVQKVEALCETDLERIVATVEASQPDLVIIDSVQTLSSSQVNGVVGGVSQVAYTTNTLLRLAKATGTSVVLIGHVTKEGVLAGPKTLEHMVDTVLYLEGERLGTLRLLRCVKNRFGSTGEVGVFEMREDGLREVLNPAGIFLEHRTEGVPGTCVTAILEGNKVLLLEVQALTNSTSFGYPRRTASGFDANRLQLLLAIMEKRMGVKMSALDVYVNVAGGFKLEERAADLPVVLAVLSSVKGKALSSSLVAFGEVGLAGEVRGVAQAEKRLKETEKLGFSEAVCPALPTGVKKPAKLKIQQVKYINFLTDLLS